jgi:CBS domain-containing protein
MVMKVHELMTRNVATCTSRDSLAHAAQLMWDRDCGVVPVVDAHGCAVGILTDRDVCMAAWTKGRPLSALRVEDAAAHLLYTIGEDDPIEVAEARMRAYQVRRLPVVGADGRLLGILSLNDLARHIRRVPGPPYAGLGGESIALTLAVISRPRSRMENDEVRAEMPSATPH